MNPLRTVGLVRRWNVKEVGSPRPFLGSCFSYRWVNRLITAAHCVRGVPTDEIAVDPTPNRGLLQVGDTEVVFHPDADIAILKSGGLQLAVDPMFSFPEIDGERLLGDDVYGFGFPVDVLGPDANLPVPRLFKGYIQRFVPDHLQGNYRFDAIELNFQCPGGLSGGPVFSTRRPHAVLGMATGNLRSTTTLESIEESPGQTTRFREIISYGVALQLDSVRDWLDSHCPPRDDYSTPASLSE